jgi:Cof subfamily protein (haloacid dehalogenase superfamily)
MIRPPCYLKGGLFDSYRKEADLRKIVFFDADQTILDMKTGIPQSAVNAVRRLTRNGHEAFLCTGRAYAFVPEELRKMGFTGIIANGGAYIWHSGKVYLDQEVSPETAERSLKILRTHQMIPVMEGTEYMYFDLDEYTDAVDGLSDLIYEQLGNAWKPITGNEKDMHIAKISAKALPGSDFLGACTELEPWYDYVQHMRGMAKGTIEFTIKGHTKGTAVRTVCEILGIPITESVCFGDSNNDITMFDAVQTKVAMGNSVPDIIQRADFVTETMFEDGIEHGLRRLKLI